MDTTPPKPDREYLPASLLASAESSSTLRSADADSTLIPWRVDVHGEQWYRRMPTMHGIPQTPIRADDDFEEDDDFEDDDFEGIDEDGIEDEDFDDEDGEDFDEDEGDD